MESIINYLCKYQNNYITHFLFQNTLSEIIVQGIKISNLLDSKILRYTIEFEEWPALHMNEQRVTRPYNDSIYDLRLKYDEIFPEPELKDMDQLENNTQSFDLKTRLKILQMDRNKVYKIKYTLSLFPSFGQHLETQRFNPLEIIENIKGQNKFVNSEVPLLEYVAKSNELDIYQKDMIINFIDYKWQYVGRRIQILSFFFHFMYMFL